MELHGYIKYDVSTLRELLDRVEYSEQYYKDRLQTILLHAKFEKLQELRGEIPSLWDRWFNKDRSHETLVAQTNMLMRCRYSNRLNAVNVAKYGNSTIRLVDELQDHIELLGNVKVALEVIDLESDSEEVLLDLASAQMLTQAKKAFVVPTTVILPQGE